MPRALFTTGGPFAENRPVIDVPENLGRDGQRSSTRMVEEQKPKRQAGEIDLIADDLDMRIL